MSCAAICIANTHVLGVSFTEEKEHTNGESGIKNLELKGKKWRQQDVSYNKSSSRVQTVVGL